MAGALTNGIRAQIQKVTDPAVSAVGDRITQAVGTDLLRYDHQNFVSGYGSLPLSVWERVRDGAMTLPRPPEGPPEGFIDCWSSFGVTTNAARRGVFFTGSSFDTASVTELGARRCVLTPQGGDGVPLYIYGLFINGNWQVTYQFPGGHYQSRVAFPVSDDSGQDTYFVVSAMCADPSIVSFNVSLHFSRGGEEESQLTLGPYEVSGVPGVESPALRDVGGTQPEVIAQRDLNAVQLDDLVEST